jgi:PKD repeat protein
LIILFVKNLSFLTKIHFIAAQLNHQLMTAFLQKLICLIFVSSFLTAQAQNSKFDFSNPNENFYQTQKRLTKHFKKHQRELARERKEKAEGHLKVGSEEEQELAGYELFKRWEAYIAPRVYPSGDKSQASRAYEEFVKYQSQNSHNRTVNQTSATQSSTWQAMGPFGDPTGGNAGRINAVRFSPSSATGLWICTPDGGLWNSANSGTNWATNTDQLGVIGNSDVVFDPTNSQIMYMASGDGDAGDSYSLGVLKSTNGGGTWAPSGLTWAVSNMNKIYKMLINPQNANVLFAATTVGLYRTTDAGVTWNVVQNGSFTDIEYKPNDTTTIYAATTDFYKSTDGGASFTIVANGLTTAGNCDRIAIAVTPANAAYVYVVGSSSANSGFYAFYQSTNSGTSFTSMATAPNLLGWVTAGTDTGGQGWYTLSIAASPTNANEVVVGGVNIWRTTNGGTNWSLFGHWTGSGAPYVHADIHDLIYKNGTTIYAGTDGGIFNTANSGATWTAINGNMNIAEIYKMGLSKTTYSLAITGHQDNGTNIYGGGWSQTLGGDGMDCFIDWSNDQVMYGEQYQGSLNVTTNGGGTWNPITTGLTGTAAWVTPIHQDPITPNTIYCGYSELFKSTNQGTAWSQLGTMGGGSSIVEFAIAPSNPQVIYVIQGTTLYKTINGGTNWTNVTGTLPVNNAQPTWVAIDSKDPNSVWVTFSGYSAGDKVYNTIDGGTTWNNYSTGLPNLPTNCITYWNGTKDGLYVGCDVGIYYRDSLSSVWALYNTGLPNVSVRDLEIFYPLGKLRAATFGRGVWEADLFNNGTQAPLANFTSDKTFICAGMTVNYTDLSTFTPTSWSWTFQSGTPPTSNQQNPAVVYNTPGTYSVTLTATNGNGGNTVTKTTYITVSPINTLPLVEGFQAATFPPANWQNYDAASDNLTWKRNATVGKASTASMYYDNYTQNASGTHDEMRTPKFDFSALTQAKMFFDVAYAQWNGTYSDSLAIMVSTDCGLTYTQLYVKGGLTLATAPIDSTAIFVPTATQWRTDTVLLNAYAGMSNVMISFQNRGHFGQAIYVDNINISGANTNNPPVAVFSNAATLCSGQNSTFTDQSSNIPNAWSWSFPGGSPPTSNIQNPVVSYSVSGTYSVTLTATNGSGSSTPTTQTVTVNTTPTITATTSAAIVCAGQQAVVLTASGATTYTWSPGTHALASYTVTPSTATVFTLTGMSASCKNTATVSVGVNALPTIGLLSTHDTLCIGGTITLSATGGQSYTWSPAGSLSSANGTTVAATPTASTTYTVTGTDANGCFNTATHHITANVCSGIDKILQKPITIYPNPNNGTFIIETTNLAKQIMRVYDINNRLVLSQPIVGKTIIDATSLADGVYNINITSNEGVINKRLVIAK